MFKSNSVRQAHGALLTAVLASVSIAGSPPVRAAAGEGRELLDLSITELMNVEVTTVAKKSQRVADTAAAVFVITQDDIRRSGARSIPEALRLVPGLEVAQIDANKWAISARGFNGRFATKLLVLMDGRTLYTPVFGAVFWDVQDTVMENIERIEVIRGPGGALWGANAVNGVINIITRAAADTQGAALSVAAFSGPSTTAMYRYGGHSGQSFDYRFYAKYFDNAGNENSSGQPTADQSHMARAGFRTDWSSGALGQISATGEVYGGRSGESLTRPIITPPYAQLVDSAEQVSGAFSTVRWQHRSSGGQEWQSQLHLDSVDRTGLLFGEHHRSAALDVQYHFQVGSRQDFVTGAGYRFSQFHIKGSSDIRVTKTDPSNADYNAFMQDEIQLLPEHLALTAGVNLEHNPLSSNRLDALPNVRLMWSVNERNHLWTGVTKAIATPSYKETTALVRNAAAIVPPGMAGNPFPVPLVTVVTPNPEFRNEQLTAYEVGYRTQPTASTTVDTTLFLQSYRDLWAAGETNVYCEPSGTPVLLNPLCVLGATDVVNQLFSLNGMHGTVSGLELRGDWSPSAKVRLRADYSYLHMVLEPSVPLPGVAEFAAINVGSSPQHQLTLRADVAATPTVDVNIIGRYVSQLPGRDIAQYRSADLNVIWRLGPQFELSLSGRNLLSAAHTEFASELGDVVPTRIRRTIGLQLRWAH